MGLTPYVGCLRSTDYMGSISMSNNVIFDFRCMKTGVTDFFKGSRKVPAWMNKEEAKLWRLGNAYAKKQLA
jgi:hypothetical protein